MLYSAVPGEVTSRSFEGTSSLNWRQMNMRFHKRIAVNLKTKANLQNPPWGGCIPFAFDCAKLAHHRACLLQWSSCWKQEVFFIKATGAPGLLYKPPLQKTPVSQVSFLQYFLCLHDAVNARVRKWGVYGSVFPCFNSTFWGWFRTHCGRTACMGFGNVHVPCKVQDAITNASCYKCQNFGFLCI